MDQEPNIKPRSSTISWSSSFQPEWHYDEILKRRWLSLLLVTLMTIYDISIILGIKKAIGVEPKN